MIWTMLHPKMEPDMLGFLPEMLDPRNPEKAAVQFDANYQHGGGWNPLAGWVYDAVDQSIKYPGDRKLKPLAMTMLRDEKILFYDSAWVAVVQADGSYEVARMD